VVSPVLHRYVVPPEAAKVVTFPKQAVTLFPAFAIGISFTITVTLSSSDCVPFELNTVTVYIVVASGETAIFAVVCPVLHRYDAPPDAMSEILSPLHIATFVPALASINSVSTETITLSLNSHPLEFVPVTVYGVVLFGLTEILADVSLVLHTYESAPEAVNVIKSPSKIETLLPALVSGNSFTVT
jgi:hypothetical protein